MSVIADIFAERVRQIEVEGRTLEHDDKFNGGGELAMAAACYAYHEGKSCPPLWPWHNAWWKPKDRRRECIIAAALLVAEIERLDRAATSVTEIPLAVPAYFGSNKR